MSNDFLVFDHVTKRFGAQTAVDDVSLSIGKGEFFSLLGPSGCGKTTLLRMLGGFERPDSGRIYLEGKDITDLPPDRRRVHTVFQNYALFPTMTVWDNVAFSLKLARYDRKEIEKRVYAMLEMAELLDQAWKYPSQLSGGQKQRVAIARALIDRPQVLLLDEPLAALDLKLRQHMLIELDAIHDQVGITFLYVTHDQSEAMSLSDRIAVVNRGKIEQIDVPAKIYEAPTSRFVASFIGDTNFFEGKVVAVEGDYYQIAVEGLGVVRALKDRNLEVGREVDLSVRPEKIRLTLVPPPPSENGVAVNCFPATIGDIVYQGAYTKFWLKLSDMRVSVIKPHSRFLLDPEVFARNDEVFVWWRPDDGFMVERQR